MKNTYIGQAWLVLSLAMVFGALLAGVEAGLSQRIAANKENETSDQIPYLLHLIDENGEMTRPFTVEQRRASDDRMALLVRDADDQTIILGWVIKGVGQGFADRIELLIGLNADGERILGMYVLAQKETPALGDRIREREFQDRFRDRWTEEPLEAVRVVTGASPDNHILAVVGATVSSESVCTIVNNAVAEFKAWLVEYPARTDHPPTEED